MPKVFKTVDETVITDVYNVLGLAPAKDRALARIVITLTPGRAIQVSEDSMPIIDGPEPVEPPAAAKE